MTNTELLTRILEQLGQVRCRCPELRFGQLLAIVGEVAADETGHALWDVEDADFAAALERFAADLGRRGEPAPAPGHDAIQPSPASASPQPPRQVG